MQTFRRHFFTIGVGTIQHNVSLYNNGDRIILKKYIIQNTERGIIDRKM